MQQLETSIARKKTVRKISIILLIAVTALTFLSKTIYGFLMPRVTTVQFMTGSLRESFETEGTVEILGKHKILAGGNWRVREVNVAVNQQVKKGDLLAVLDKDDILIDLKKKELEILKMENALESYKQNFKPINISDYERNVQNAKEALDEAKENLDAIKALYDTGAETKKNLDAAEKNYRDKLQAYESSKALLEEKIRENAVKKEEYDRTVKEKTAELEIKKMEFEREKIYYPEDGRLLSDMDGTITAVNIQPGMTTAPNQAIFEMTGEKSPYRVYWYLNAEKSSNYDVGHQVNLVVKAMKVAENEGEEKAAENKSKNGNGKIETVTLKFPIAGKEFLSESDRFKFWMDINEEQIKNMKLLVNEGQKVKVWAVLLVETHENVIPKSCITEIQGKPCIFILREKRGALGMEKYVEMVEVSIISEDDYNVALDGYFNKDEKVVASTTKPLKDLAKVQER